MENAVLTLYGEIPITVEVIPDGVAIEITGDGNSANVLLSFDEFNLIAEFVGISLAYSGSNENDEEVY